MLLLSCKMTYPWGWVCVFVRPLKTCTFVHQVAQVTLLTLLLMVFFEWIPWSCASRHPEHLLLFHPETHCSLSSISTTTDGFSSIIKYPFIISTSELQSKNVWYWRTGNQMFEGLRSSSPLLAKCLKRLKSHSSFQSFSTVFSFLLFFQKKPGPESV